MSAILDGSGSKSSPPRPDATVLVANNPLMALGLERLGQFSASMNLVNVFSTSTELSALYNAMRADLNSLESLLVLYRARWNADAAAFNRLPLEIRYAIFMLVAQDDRPRPPIDNDARARNLMGSPETRDNREPDFLEGKGGHIGWMRLGHVCSLWRRTLINMPSLWATDIGRLPCGVDMMLRRAGTLPLTVSVLHSRFRLGAMTVCSQLATDVYHNSLAQRLRALDWYDTGSATLSILTTLLETHSFPLLQKLSVRILGDSISLDAGAPDMRAPLTSP